MKNKVKKLVKLFTNRRTPATNCSRDEYTLFLKYCIKSAQTSSIIFMSGEKAAVRFYLGKYLNDKSKLIFRFYLIFK